MLAEVLEEQKLDSGGLMLAVQTSGSIQWDALKNLLADVGVCGLEN